jgi:hypothetical protein
MELSKTCLKRDLVFFATSMEKDRGAEEDAEGWFRREIRKEDLPNRYWEETVEVCGFGSNAMFVFGE